ncbi:type 1 glutamine amidotransferase [Alicyclobacillus ferrooxydans]|uniref:Lipid II isoglutaminyl synthase (glutamine-hydrolyzing) subunit GatD n=1 Tax=Alicyclobacillus ferrooxydans TaxID=471514 RepID=A0A0P9EHJ3_9BACL|nr:glutamine amidotransferase [Alicyclobacillus ferrooxydans]KPV42098.1 glutamine amidotransferase [Alicyclobacillus ferrooxydans]
MQRPLCIAHLYPDLLNLYADKGNIQTLVSRCQWRGIDVEVVSVPAGTTPRLSDYDLVLLGGGSDREQALVGRTLLSSQPEWKAAVEDGLPLLAICGGYQLLGEYYQLPNKAKVPGLSLLDLITEAGEPRLIGNVAISSEECGMIIGFENHGGRTTHSHDVLGRVKKGFGNNGTDGGEGVRYKNVFGTYIHGPLLPKNPALADLVLKTALEHASGNTVELEPLDDRFETAARKAFLERRIQLPEESVPAAQA